MSAPRVQVGVHVILLLAAATLAGLVIPDASLKPADDGSPIGQILLLLGLSVGLPYFCLATTGPLIQYWFARSGAGGSVFRLYALSNLGSFLALLSFPYVFEPLFELPQLGRFWTWGFWAFALLCAAVTLHALRPGRVPAAGAAASETGTADLLAQPTPMQRLRWVALPALASLAFIATTDHVSHNIAPEPRLWIATLALYLLTFVICFDHPRWYRRGWVALAGLVAVVFVAGRNEIPGWFGQDWDYGVAEVRWIHLTTMFLVCLMSHGELYRQRPGNPRYLTEFYLWMSFGGACGGLFVALVATNFFADYYEWPLFLVAAIGLACFILASQWGKSGRRAKLAASAACALLGGLVLFWEDPLDWRGSSGAEYTDIRLHQSRNFYGTVSVEERRYLKDPSESYRVFYSGRVTHGVQYLDPAKRRLPVSYYSEGSGAGETLLYAQARQPSLRVAIVGLGAGTLATYAREEDQYDFYEINPEAVQVASRWFDNVPGCRAGSKRVIVGDARLKLEQLPDEVRYDVIVLDAFSGGSVPIHLLTRPATLSVGESQVLRRQRCAGARGRSQSTRRPALDRSLQQPQSDRAAGLKSPLRNLRTTSIWSGVASAGTWPTPANSATCRSGLRRCISSTTSLGSTCESAPRSTSTGHLTASQTFQRSMPRRNSGPIGSSGSMCTGRPRLIAGSWRST